MRTRINTSAETSGRGIMRYHEGTTGVDTEYPPLYFLVRKESEVFMDTPHPGFFKRIKSGELIISPMFHNTLNISCGGGAWSASHIGYPPSSFTLDTDSLVMWASNQPGFFTLPVFQIPNLDDMVAAAKQEALANIDSAPQSFTEDILTWRQNLNFARSALSDVYTQIRKIRNSGASMYVRTKPMSDLWATYRFGFTPSLQSLEDAYQLMLKGFTTLEKDIRLRSGGGKTQKFVTDDIESNSNVTVQKRIDAEVKVKATVYYKLRKPSSGLAFNVGTRFKDLPTGFWAVVPYSFMIDRVINISRMSQALMNLADPNIVIEGGCYSVHVESRCATTITAMPYNFPADWAVNFGGSDTLVDDRRQHDRYLWTPTYTDAIPPVDFKGLVSDIQKITDLAALIRQRLK